MYTNYFLAEIVFKYLLPAPRSLQNQPKSFCIFVKLIQSLSFYRYKWTNKTRFRKKWLLYFVQSITVKKNSYVAYFMDLGGKIKEHINEY